MRVGLISDTHSNNLNGLWPYLDIAFADVELILHAGDITGRGVLEELEAAYALVKAVRGNCDGWEFTHLPEHQRLELAGVPIGLTHGTGSLRDQTERVWMTFCDGAYGDDVDDVSAIIHGHSHVARFDEHNGVAIINPGSASSGRDGRGESVAVLKLGDGIDVDFFFFNDMAI